jgi:16S rRNA G966 N2-methylase RsmD
MNKLEKMVFPLNNRIENTLFKFDKIGLYSVSVVKDAKSTTYFMCEEISKFKKLSKYLTIMDGTGGLGGNTISFCFAFEKVLSYEINSSRCEMLKSNLSNYKFTNCKVFNKNSLDNLNKNIDIYFFDPPWGGPTYKNEDNIKLELNNYSMKDIVIKIKKLNENAFVSFKLPYNYDMNEFSDWTIKKLSIRNTLIVLVLPEK